MESRKKEAMELFKSGYNCTQSVVLAHADLIDIDEKKLSAMVEPFGGGMGRLRSVCGAVTGMFFVLGALKGNSDIDAKKKKETYDYVQRLAYEFEKKNGSIICKQLLGLEDKESYVSEEYKTGTTPEPRTKTYYEKRPCLELVAQACDILAQIL